MTSENGAGTEPVDTNRLDLPRAPVDRTSLSWQRTSLQASLVALVAATTALQLGEPRAGLAAAVIAVVAIVAGATTPRVHNHSVARHEPWRLMLRTVLVLGASATVTVTLVVALALRL